MMELDDVLYEIVRGMDKGIQTMSEDWPIIVFLLLVMACATSPTITLSSTFPFISFTFDDPTVLPIHSSTSTSSSSRARSYGGKHYDYQYAKPRWNRRATLPEGFMPVRSWSRGGDKESESEAMEIGQHGENQNQNQCQSSDSSSTSTSSSSWFSAMKTFSKRKNRNSHQTYTPTSYFDPMTPNSQASPCDSPIRSGFFSSSPSPSPSPPSPTSTSASTAPFRCASSTTSVSSSSKHRSLKSPRCYSPIDYNFTFSPCDSPSSPLSMDFIRRSNSYPSTESDRPLNTLVSRGGGRGGSGGLSCSSDSTSNTSGQPRMLNISGRRRSKKYEIKKIDTGLDTVLEEEREEAVYGSGHKSC